MEDSSNLMSPPRTQIKERRNPSITPRKFKRFFTPRSRVSSQPSRARRALRDLTASTLNRALTPSSPLKPIVEENGLENLPVLHGHNRSAKKRKLHHTPETSPFKFPPSLNSSPAFLAEPPTVKPALLSPIHSLHLSPSSHYLTDSEDEAHSDDELPGESRSPRRLVPLTRRGLSAHLVQRMAGDMPRAGRQFMSYPVADWRTETANFYSRPGDVHMCASHEGATRCIPFCAASCHSNSLVAIGDEEGHVRLLDSEESFDKEHLSFQVHSNAVIDLAFSEDDMLLATASGDQTGKVIDMMTQSPVSILTHHTASLKQVRFQPGRSGGSVLATSGRDGSVQVWDLRFRGGPVQEVAITRDSSLGYRVPRQVHPGCVVNSIYDAHTHGSTVKLQPPAAGLSGNGDVPSRSEVPGRIGDVSVTSLQFMPAGREHLLLSACEADASIKLWDIRSIHTSRHHKSSIPIASTAQPDSHASWRPFGISSLTLSTDGSRLYALCKDNTVYAYSTAHLVLGSAPELSFKAAAEPPRRRLHGAAHEGLGPMYGFRHPLFHATSFYVKAAVRPAAEGRSELLAVGSSDGCAVLFPTDERYMRDAWDAQARGLGLDGSSFAPGGDATMAGFTGPRRTAGGRPGLFRTNSLSNLSARLVDTIPIVRDVGTPLVRGHDKEVGALAWASGGRRLVTVGDDYLARCWGESREEAADLRTGGEAGGRRWACGWADVGEDWDGDQDDW